MTRTGKSIRSIDGCGTSMWSRMLTLFTFINSLMQPRENHLKIHWSGSLLTSSWHSTLLFTSFTTTLSKICLMLRRRVVVIMRRVRWRNLTRLHFCPKATLSSHLGKANSKKNYRAWRRLKLSSTVYMWFNSLKFTNSNFLQTPTLWVSPFSWKKNN